MNICPWRHTPHIHTKQFRCSDGKAVSGTICCVTDTICGGLVVNILSGVIRSYVLLSSFFIFCFNIVMATPANPKLYEQVTHEIYKNPIRSAYRSALLVKTYKERGALIKAKKINRPG